MILISQELVVIVAHDRVSVHAHSVLLVACDEAAPYVHVVVVDDVRGFGGLAPLTG